MAHSMLRGDSMKRFRVRGFTLVELMIVVAIVGILAALGLYGFRKYLSSANSGEAKSMLASMKIAQESYRSENLTYAGCDGTAGGAPKASTAGDIATGWLYPRALVDINDRKIQWGGASSVGTCFSAIGFRSSGAVRFSYGVRAGLPGASVTHGGTLSPSDVAFDTNAGMNIGVLTPKEPWYIAIAVGNLDNDTKYSLMSTTSQANEVQVGDEGE